ncbi:MAG: AsmA family protein [Lentisphaeria bacterium]|nr:AsmA family protein [Victivallales bacterium]MBR6058147.1 AsmA family protein [Victivallales bacterium]MCR4572526.1 AsmA family protein [Lentisphaeria bacterium]
MKALKIIGIILVILIVVLFIAVMNIGSIVKTGINTVVPQVTKCEAHVDDVSFNVFSGKFEIKDLVINNPEGYNTDHAFSLGHIFVKVKMGTLFSDIIEIDQVLIDSPEITYEVGLGNSNLNTILENVNAALPASDEEEKKEEKPKDDKPGKKVIVNLVKVTNGKIGISAKIAGGMEAPIVLPDIEIKDLGKKEGGISMIQAAAVTLKTTLLSIFDVLKSSGKLLIDSAKAIGESIGEGVKSIGEGAKDLGKDAVEGLKNLIPGKK